MIRQGHIDRSQAVLLLWFAIGAKVILTFPGSMVACGLTSAWMILVGGGLVSLLGYLPGIALMRRFRDVSFARAADEAGGLVAGKLFSLLATGLLVGLAALALRQFSEAFSMAILPRTPLRVITISFALITAYCAYLGLETTGRLVVFATPWIAVLLGIIVVSSFGQANFLRLFPLWGEPPLQVLTDSLRRSSLYAEILILPILYPYLREPAEAVPVGRWAILLAMFVLAGVEVVVIAVFDVLDTDQLAFPIIHLARMISLGRFATRIDPLVVFLWIFVAALKITIVLWAAATVLAESLRLPDHRPLFAPLTAITVCGALLFADLETTAIAEFQFVRSWAWIVAFVLPLGLWLAAVIRGKGSLGAAGREGGS